KKVILVSKDVNLRLKAKALGLQSEDYTTGKVQNISSLYSGKTIVENVNPDMINLLYDKGYCVPEEILGTTPAYKNHYYILKSGKKSALAYYNPLNGMVEHVEKRSVYGIKARNAEQTFAMHALLKPEIRLVSIQGVAAAGETRIARAASLEQRRDLKQIYLTRPIVPLSNREIGYLPGDIESKLNHYMAPLWENRKCIQNRYSEADKEYQLNNEMV